MKPLNGKSYGSIPHLLGSRLGPGDHHCHEGQHKICTEKVRDKWDLIIVQEKLDGGNVGIAKINGIILPLTRAGYLASSSPFKTHHIFDTFVKDNERRFNLLLNEGERLCGEWLLTAVGTKYKLPHEPFVPFDLMRGNKRLNYSQFVTRLKGFDFILPRVLMMGRPCGIEEILPMIQVSGHGALEAVEGAIWRVERKNDVDFLCKYVRHEKIDGKYLKDDICNELPILYRKYIEGFEKLVKPDSITETDLKTSV